MRKVVVSAGLVLLLAAGGWLVLGGETPRSGNDPRGSEARAQGVEIERDRASSKPEAKELASKPPKRTASKQDREAMRRRIVEAMQARERTAAERDGSSTGADEGPSDPTRKAASPTVPAADEPPAAGDLIDRTGNHGYLMKVMNEDLIPLADECYALARETQPELTGMLVLDLEIIGDEEIGGVIETAAPGQGNELADPGLIECVRESLFSTTLPAPPEGGKDAISLSLRLEPEE